MAIQEDSVEGSVRLMESNLGLPSGFLENIKNEDDWSFIIKIHAFLEAAISHLICKALEKDSLIDIFSRIPLSDKQGGKMEFVKSLDLLHEQDRRFIKSLSELRNKLVHDINNVSFDFLKYIEDMDSSQFQSFSHKFNSFSTAEQEVDYYGKMLKPAEVFRRDPKTAIWWSAMVTVAIIYQKHEMQKLQTESNRLSNILDYLTK